MVLVVGEGIGEEFGKEAALVGPGGEYWGISVVEWSVRFRAGGVTAVDC